METVKRNPRLRLSRKIGKVEIWESARITVTKPKRRSGPIPKELGHFHISLIDKWKYNPDGWAYHAGQVYKVSVKVGPGKFRITVYNADDKDALLKVRSYIIGVRTDLGLTAYQLYKDLPMSLDEIAE